MGWLFSTWSLAPALIAFVTASAVIGVVGVRLAKVVDVIADRTGLGEALAGAMLLGAATSLAGLVVSAVAAADGNASLAVSNSLGGIAAQTAFIVAADLALRGVNLEHVAASVTNVFATMVLMVLLGLVLVGVTGPDVTVLGVHPVTPLMVVVYVVGLRLGRATSDERMWEPRQTEDTLLDTPDEDDDEGSTPRLLVSFVLLAATIALAGFVVGRSGLSLIVLTGLSGTFVGTVFTSVATSLPELVTSIAAVRAGAPTLAVGGIVGGNSFDVLFIAVGDVAYREGSIYAAVGQADIFVLAWTLVIVAVAGAGLIRRQRDGIGFEGMAILGTYLAGVVILGFM